MDIVKANENDTPLKNRAWILARRPQGNDIQGALDLVQNEVAELVDGQIRIRNGYFSLDAGTRMWMSERTDSYDPPLPLGSPMRGQALGVVVESRHPDWFEGQLLRYRGQWGDYSVISPRDADQFVQPVSWEVGDLRQHLGALGPSGWTAFAGMVEVGQARPGETVLVSAASGVTGSLAGQIAKIQGCRVVGITGSQQKGHWIVDELGFDSFINRTANDDLAAAIGQACPEGVDVHFENVGGPILDAALQNMNMYGRIAVCGLLAQYARSSALPGPAHFDQVLARRLRIEGFLTFDRLARTTQITRELQEWFKQGRLKLSFSVSDGVESMPAAYERMLAGDKVGKSLVDLGTLR